MWAEPWGKIPHMGARDHLAVNLGRLMSAPNSKYANSQAVETATDKLAQNHERKIGRSTVQRILKAETPVNLDYVETLAELFGVKAWQLVAPASAAQVGNDSEGDEFEGMPPTLDQAVMKISEVMEAMTPMGREFAVGVLGALAKSPEEAPALLETLQDLARVHQKPEPVPPPTTRTRAPKPSTRADAKKTDSKPALVLKIGGGNRQQFSLPLSRRAFEKSQESASPSERAFYDRVKAARKANER